MNLMKKLVPLLGGRHQLGLPGIRHYLAWRYPQVNSDLCFRGWMTDILVDFKKPEDLKAYNQTGLTTFLVPLPQDSDLVIEEVKTPSSQNPDLSVLIYRSKQTRPQATGLLWLHGGGYALGHPRLELPFIRQFVLETNTVVLAPDYRLSAQEPYPAALEDAYASLVWLKEEAEHLGVNPDQLFVGGPSAGGGLTIATVLYARDRNQVQVAFHMPIYPMIDDRLSTESMKGNRQMIWNEIKNQAGWQLYLGDLYGSEEVPIYAAPYRALDLSGMPPAYTHVGDLDPFLDETLDYMKRLQTAGVAAKYRVYPGAYHGYEAFDCPLTRQTMADWLAAYKEAVSQYFAPQKES